MVINDALQNLHGHLLARQVKKLLGRWLSPFVLRKPFSPPSNYGEDNQVQLIVQRFQKRLVMNIPKYFSIISSSHYPLLWKQSVSSIQSFSRYRMSTVIRSVSVKLNSENTVTLKMLVIEKNEASWFFIASAHSSLGVGSPVTVFSTTTRLFPELICSKTFQRIYFHG